MKYEIEIEGLPEGYSPVRFGMAKKGDYVFYCGRIQIAVTDGTVAIMIVEKIKPRRIILEETQEDNGTFGKDYMSQYFGDNRLVLYLQPKIWREVTEDEEQK